MAEQKPTKKEYRLLAKAFTTLENGVKKIHAKGAIVQLSDSQYVAFKDQFEPKNVAAMRAQAVADADAQAEAKNAKPLSPAEVKAANEAKALAEAKEAAEAEAAKATNAAKVDG